MKFEVTQQNLANCLRNVSPFVNNKGHQLEILRRNVLLKTDRNLLCVLATNLNASIVEYVSGSSSGEGLVTVPVGLLRDYVQNLPADEKITLETSSGKDQKPGEGKLTVTCSTARATINAPDPSEYPVFPTHKKQSPVLTTKADQLRNNLAQVVFASSQDINRPIIASVCLHSFEGNLYMVATDGSRLAEKRLETKTKAKELPDDWQVLIPRQNLMPLERVLSTQDEKPVAVHISSHQKGESAAGLMFVVGDGEIEVHTSLIEGTYMDYRKLIPDNFATEITVRREDLIAAAKRADLFSQENSFIILDWQDSDDRLNVRSSVSQIGDGEEDIPAQITNSKPKDSNHKVDTAITLNAKYLQEALQAVELEYVKLSLNPPLGRFGPCLLQACHKNKKPDDAYRHVVMPIDDRPSRAGA